MVSAQQKRKQISIFPGGGERDDTDTQSFLSLIFLSLFFFLFVPLSLSVRAEGWDVCLLSARGSDNDTVQVREKLWKRAMHRRRKRVRRKDRETRKWRCINKRKMSEKGCCDTGAWRPCWMQGVADLYPGWRDIIVARFYSHFPFSLYWQVPGMNSRLQQTITVLFFELHVFPLTAFFFMLALQMTENLQHRGHFSARVSK